MDYDESILSMSPYLVGINHFYPDHLQFTRKGIRGTPLAEVLSVIVTPHNEGCQLYGRIQVDDSAGSVLIYNLGPENSHTLSSSREALILSNRDRAIFGDGHLTVSLDLKDKNGDVEVIRGSFTWSGSHYNEILVENIEGKLGSAEVSYIVHWAAVEVNIWAQFDREHASSDGDNVDFELVARYKKRYNTTGQDSDALNVFKGRLMGAKNGGVFPLDRGVFSLPCHMNLVIEARLLDDCDDSNSCSAKVEYPIEDITLQATHKELKGKWGSVKVSVETYDYLFNSLKDVDHAKIVHRHYGLFPEWLRESAWLEDSEEEEEEEEEEEGEQKRRRMTSPSKNSMIDDEAVQV